jgi:membrane protein
VFVGSLSIPEVITQTANSILSFLVTIALFALIYKVIPDLDLEYRDVLLGAAVTALLFTLGRVLIGIYLGKAGVASTYGAAGSLVLVLFWVYYSAQVFFLGAAFTRVFAERYGSKPRVRHQQPLVDQTGVPVTRPPSPATVITPETDATARKT